MILSLWGCGEVNPCAADPHSPRSIDGVVERIADLPMPLDLPCFLASLERPLQLHATSDVFSAQPATGQGSPRIFIQSGPLVFSVVPEGPGRSLLEFGQQLTVDSSLKGEMQFPLRESPSFDDPFIHVLRGSDGTACGLCHGQETEVAENRFASRPLRPLPSTNVSIEWLAEQSTVCEGASDRCEMLDGIFGHGPVEYVPLPDTWGTIYEPVPL